jgi:hypothetical protein
VCADCAGIYELPVCSRCHAEGRIQRGLCPACLLVDRVDDLRAAAAPERAARLAPYLEALARSPNPASALRWMQTPPFAHVRALVVGEVELSHAGLDRLPGAGRNGGAVAFLRAALVEHGVLEPRDEASAAFARWLEGALAELPTVPITPSCRRLRSGTSRTDSPARAAPGAWGRARTPARRSAKRSGWPSGCTPTG